MRSVSGGHQFKLSAPRKFRLSAFSTVVVPTKNENPSTPQHSVLVQRFLALERLIQNITSRRTSISSKIPRANILTLREIFDYDFQSATRWVRMHTLQVFERLELCF
jgi:hypothetical protein